MQSYRVYLQHVSSIHSPQFHSSDQTNINTSSILVKVPQTATCQDLVLLLRKKLTLSCPEFFPSTSAPPHESKSSSSSSSVFNSNTHHKDSLVLVLTSPGFIHFDHHETLSNVHSNKDKLFDGTHAVTGSSSLSKEGESILLEPVHFVHSLTLDECPAQVQHSMVQKYLQKIQSFQHQEKETAMAMEIRWFFIPSSLSTNVLQSRSSSSTISPLFPTFIELEEGYCTGEESSDDEDDDLRGSHPDPGREEETKQRYKSNIQESILHTFIIKERRKMASLNHALLSHQNECITGYLLKQCSSDPFVWRRVYCILVDDGFWWIFRTKTYSSDPHSSSFTLGRHGYIPLSDATILKVNHPYIPHVFEISSSSQGNKTFTFRSNKRSVEVQWIEWLSSRIASCHCDHWMVMADVMMDQWQMQLSSHQHRHL